MTTGKITKATGGYSEIIRSEKHQQKILSDFPWLWVMIQRWPFVGNIVVSNDLQAIGSFLGKSPMLSDNIKSVWVKLSSEHATMTINVSEKLFEGFRLHHAMKVRSTWAQTILDHQMNHPHLQLENIAIIEKDQGSVITIFRTSKSQGVRLQEMCMTVANCRKLWQINQE